MGLTRQIHPLSLINYYNNCIQKFNEYLMLNNLIYINLLNKKKTTAYLFKKFYKNSYKFSLLVDSENVLVEPQQIQKIN